MSAALGIDVGGSGIKGAKVDLEIGDLVTERIRIPTPQPATPIAVMEVIGRIVGDSEWAGPVGVAFPAAVQDGVVRTATNIHDSWIGTNARDALSAQLGQPVFMLNDADAAGIAEMRYGAGVDYRDRGIVMMLTFGTGIGSAIFTNGELLPNTELGGLELDGHIAEERAAARLREDKEISWEKWIKRVQEYLSYVESLFFPDLIIFGGGISKRSDRFMPELKTRAQLVPAKLLNNAGIVGAAYAVQLQQDQMAAP